MEDMVMSVDTLPEPLSSRFRSEMVWVHEEQGVVILTPVCGPWLPEAFTFVASLQRKERRREILRSLYGSLDDPTLVEPMEVEYESPRDWGMMDL